MTHDEIALLRTCLLHSFDQAPLLILADWYEEHDQYEKALLLRANAANLVLSASAIVDHLFVVGTSSGRGFGDGTGNGYGTGYGNGHGYGDGHGHGDKNDGGSGHGHGYGDGYGDGDGDGDGDGYGCGDGDGYGRGELADD